MGNIANSSCYFCDRGRGVATAPRPHCHAVRTAIHASRMVGGRSVIARGGILPVRADGSETCVDVSLAELGIVEELACAEPAAKVEAHVYGLDVVGGEVGGILLSPRLQADAEDAQLVEIDGLALQQQLAQAILHLDENAAYGALAEHAVVVGHVGDELLECHRLVGGAAIDLAVTGRCGVCVLVLLELNHSGFVLKFCDNIAGAKVRRCFDPGTVIGVCGMFHTVKGGYVSRQAHR